MNEYQIDLTSYKYYPSMSLSNASLVQIMIAIQNTTSRLEKTENEFQEILYPWLLEKSNEIVEKFKQLLFYTSEHDRNTRFYNLSINTKKSENEFHKKITLKHGNFGPFIDACLERITNILKAGLPVKFKDNQHHFDKLAKELTEFQEFLQSLIEPYKNIVDKAREVAGVNIVEVREKRKEKH